MKKLYLPQPQIGAEVVRVPFKKQPSGGIRKSPFVKSGLEDGHGREIKYPFQPGEIVYVPETFDYGYDVWGIRCVSYKARGDNLVNKYWLSPVCMGAEDARHFARIIEVSAGQVQGVTELECRSMGFPFDEGYNAKDKFLQWWNERYPGSWERNDWTWTLRLEWVDREGRKI